MRSDNEFVSGADAHKWLLSACSVTSQTDTQPSGDERPEVQLGVPDKPREIQPLRGFGKPTIVSDQNRQE